MPRDPGRTPRLPLSRRRGRVLLPTLAILAALALAFAVFTAYYTELLWFRSVDASGVYNRRLGTSIVLFVVFGALMSGAVLLNAVLAHRARPSYVATSQEQQSLDRYRMGIEPYRRPLVVGLSVLLGLLAGGAAAGEWKTFMLWRYGGSFGTSDPQFGMDVSFFTFDLPWYRFLLGFGFALTFISLLVSVAVLYLYGAIRLQGVGDRTTTGARVHVSVLLGVFVLLKAVAYFLDRYSLEIRDARVGRAELTGMTYTDINALLPAKTILAWVAVICAVLCFANIARRTWVLPGLGVGTLVIAAVLIGGLVPALFQQFRVKPSEADREAAQIERNIAQTRQAYQLEDVDRTPFNATAGAQVPQDSPTVENARLIDPLVVSDTFTAREQDKAWYEFASPLDVDRYDIDGEQVETVVAVREIDTSKLDAGQRNWTNERTVYTHGYGFVAAPSDTPTTNGEPAFLRSGALQIDEPRVYFGEKSPTYSIVGAPEGSAPYEVDNPEDDRSRNTYAGGGGVSIGSFLNRSMYALKYRDTNLLLSNRVNSESRILYDRQPRHRVEKVAPWLTVDGNPYPAIVNGKIMWILDGYTTSNSYPYSTRTELGSATADILNATEATVVARQSDQRVNYIRNSVKATVDAYTGEVNLYAWDEDDPILKAWRSAFPGTVQDRDALGEVEGLLDHIRYPEDLFKVQRELYSRYHVDDPRTFFSSTDFWRIPQDPTRNVDNEVQPPYYLTLQTGDMPDEAFSLTTTFVPIGRRDNLTAFMTVNSDPNSDEYGKIRVLAVPSTSGQINGPQLAQNALTSNQQIAERITLLQGRGGSSRVEYGNLLTLPVGSGDNAGFVYVEPVYVRASTGTTYPLLQIVLASDGTRNVYASTLDDALAQLERLRQGSGGATPPTTTPPTEETPAPGATTPPPTTGGGGTTLEEALLDAQEAYQAGQEALQRGDFTAYGQAQQRLKDALDRATAASNRRGASGGAADGGAATPSASPTAAASPAAAPTPGSTAAPR
ncbi:UPF0182 family protein [Motilibacter sp. K478]|nr:UPF0182 family protein [Motilibacter aurantiacus]NHC45638.1 UPF0182 family protein [Motilibacter aurantiacus]